MKFTVNHPTSRHFSRHFLKALNLSISLKVLHHTFIGKSTRMLFGKNNSSLYILAAANCTKKNHQVIKKKNKK